MEKIYGTYWEGEYIVVEPEWGRTEDSIWVSLCGGRNESEYSVELKYPQIERLISDLQKALSEL